jgi:predicted nucleic acid-binding protein
MAVLADTGILLRLLEPTDPQHPVIRQAVRLLNRQGNRLVTSPQNVAEFWNVCTRPATARGGLGLTIAGTERRLRIVERIFPVLPDNPAAYPLWRNLVVSLGVMGVQVHDARLVAFMMAQGLMELLTLNAPDFSRYTAVTALTPAAVVGTSP